VYAKLWLFADFNFNDVSSFVHLFLLLYADDTVILAETPEEMQKALDKLNTYCKSYGLNINVSKTKVMIFSRGKVRKLPNLRFNNVPLEIVWEYKYLGTLFNYNNTFNKAKESQCASARRAVFSILKNSRKLDLPIDLTLDLFDKCVKPILLYGSEVWGFEQMCICDKVQLSFFKMLLNVKSSTPSCMLYGELGKYPVSLDATTRVLCFWYKLCKEYTEGLNKLSILLLRLTTVLYINTTFKSNWLTCVHKTLNNLGLSYIWLLSYNCNLSLAQFKHLVKQRIQDQFIQSWRHDVHETNVSLTYRLFKQNFNFENYLTILPLSKSKILLKFRLSSHKLPIQRLRYSNVPLNERICNICDRNELGDEFHYLFNCSFHHLKSLRKQYFPRYYLHNPNVIKLQQLMNSKSKKQLVKLTLFVKCIMSQFN